MERLLRQQNDLLKFGEDLLRDAGAKMRAAGADALAQAWDNAVGFAHAVDWTERWILVLLATHLCVLATAIALRESEKAQAVVFIAVMTVIFLAERVNGLAATHWRSFSRQNYFDERGVFASAVLSGPLLLTQFVVLANVLRMMVREMIRTKRAELKWRHRNRRKREEEAGDGTDAAVGGDGGEDKKHR